MPKLINIFSFLELLSSAVVVQKQPLTLLKGMGAVPINLCKQKQTLITKSLLANPELLCFKIFSKALQTQAKFGALSYSFTILFY